MILSKIDRIFFNRVSRPKMDIPGRFVQGRRQSSIVKYSLYSIYIKLYNFCCLYKRKKSKQTTEENFISKLI